jgi:hypothetical protein
VALLAALVAAWFGASTSIAVIVAAGGFLLIMVVMAFLWQRAFFGFATSLPALFPSPKEVTSG